MQVQHLLHLFPLSAEYLQEWIFVLITCKVGVFSWLPQYPTVPKAGIYILLCGKRLGYGFLFFPHEQDSQIKEENVFEQQPKLHTIRGKAKCLAQSCPAVLGLWSSSHLLLLFLSLIPPYLCTSFCPSCVKVELIWLYILPSKPIFSVGYWVQCENSENGVCKAGKNDRVSSCLFSSGWNCHL